jgi:cbb3-type cytochrome oxidase cytochrome c subunit
MDASKPRKSVLLILAVLLVVAWGIIIWVATLVTQTALETLSYIVELAQMTP